MEQAVQMLGSRVGEVLRQSSFYETEPWGFESEHAFLNAVVCCQTRLAPREVLRATQKIERELGKRQEHATERTETVPGTEALPDDKSSLPAGNPALQTGNLSPQTVVYKDRPIDIDILLYDDWHVDEPGLTIPHPLMYEREFVMKPLREIENNN